MNISKWALKNDKLIWFIVLIMCIGGMYAYYQMPKLEDPVIAVKQAMVVATLPGGSPYEMELEVADPLEKAIRSMKGVSSVTSKSMSDLTLINVTLQTTVPDDGIEQYWDILRRKVNDAASDLPDGSSVTVMDDYGDVYGIFYAMTSDGFSNEEMIDYANLVKREIQEVDGVSKVEIYGEYTPSIDVSVYQDKLATLGVMPIEVIQTIQNQNATVYPGYYESGGQRIRLSINDKYRTVEELGNVLIQGHEDDQLRLKDIATLTESYQEPVRNSMYYDGQPAIGISISALNSTDILKVGKAVDEKVQKLVEDRIPVGLEFHKVFFQPEEVHSSISTFLVNLLESVVIVVVVLMIFMGIRSGVLLGIVLVITVLGSILGLHAFGGTLQRVSLASFVLAMGMLVDNAIVIVDGILIAKQQGKPRINALTDIGGQTAMPLLGATLVAIMAFLPLYLSPDTTGTYVRDLFIVLCISLLLSWIISLTLVPLMSDNFLKVKATSGELYQGKVYDILRSTLRWGLRHKGLTIFIMVALIVGSVVLFKSIPSSFFPDMSYDQLYIEYKSGENNSGKSVKEELDQVSEYLLSRDDVRHVTMSLGGTPSRYNLVRSIALPALSYGELIVDFTSSKELVKSFQEVQDYLTEHFPDSYIRLKRYNLMYSNYPVEACFSGPDPEVLESLVEKTQDIMKNVKGAELVTSDWGAKVPYIVVDYNQPQARRSGRSRQELSLSLLASTDGIPVSTIYEGLRKEVIVLRSVDKNGNPIEMLNNVPTFSILPMVQNIDRDQLLGLATGSVTKEDLVESVIATVPLSQSINGLDLKWEYANVIRKDGQRAMRAQCNVMPGYTADQVKSVVAKELSKIDIPEGYELSWEGEAKASADSMKYLFSTLPFAIIMMIAILIMLFGSYKKTLIIFSCVPMLFVGAMLGIWISGKSMGFVAIAGILGLIGMMIKTGVVLMDEINLRMTGDVDQEQVLIDSSASRLRAVSMSSLTTILGMLPLLSDDLFGSLAATIMGGLTVGTVVTLVVIPVLYDIFFPKKKTKS